MGASTNLSSTTVGVAPGATATVSVRVRNTATVVDQMRFEVIGDAREWTRVEPATLSLFPGDEGTVEVIFAPPRLPSVPAGPMPFGIKVQPNEDAEGSAVEEGTLQIEAFWDVTAELVPRTSRGRRRAFHDLAVDNRSNVAYRADVIGTDKDLHLGFASDPPMIDIPAGSAGFAKVRVKPHRRFWRGPSQTRPFQVLLQPNAGLAGLGLETADASIGGESGADVGDAPSAGTAPSAATTPPGSGAFPATPPPAAPPAPTPAGATSASSTSTAATPRVAGAPPGTTGPGGTQLSAEVPIPAPSVVIDGSFVQEALLPKWLFKVLALIVALAVIAAALWLTLVKPQIKAAAKNQVSRQLAAAGITTTTTTTLPKGAPGAPTTVAGAAPPTTTAAGPSTGVSPGQSSTATTTPASTALSGTPIDGRLNATGNGTQAYVVPKGKTFQLTDLVFENPNGDTGDLVLSRNGTILFQIALANFRDLDYHMVAPVIFNSTDQMELTISACTDACQPGLFYSGYLK